MKELVLAVGLATIATALMVGFEHLMKRLRKEKPKPADRKMVDYREYDMLMKLRNTPRRDQ